MRSILYVLALLVAHPVYAAQPIAPTPAASTAPDDADRLVKQQGFEQTMAFMMKTMAPLFGSAAVGQIGSTAQGRELMASLGGGDAGNVRLQAVLAEEFATAFRAGYPELTSELAAFYRANMTPAELKAVADFFAAGPGGKFMALMPRSQVQLSDIGGKLGERAGQVAGLRAITRLTKEVRPR